MPPLVTYILGSVQVFVEDLWTRLASFNLMIESYFGPPGKWAFWILLSSVTLLLLGKAAKVAFDVFRFVLLPSAALSVVLLMLVPEWSAMKSFPVFVALSAVVMLFRSN